jgi:hypothetical protein
MKPVSLKSNLPGLLTISLCLLVQAIQVFLRHDAPHTYYLKIGRFDTEVALNVGLLLALPIIGCLGSLTARRMGDSRMMAVRAVLSPVALASAMLMALMVVDVITTRALLNSLEYSSGIVVGWVLVPAAALLLGGLAGWNFPLVREKARQ